MADNARETSLSRSAVLPKPVANAAGDSLPMDIEAPDYTERLYDGLLRRFWHEEGGVANRPKSADDGGPTKKGLSQEFLLAYKKKHRDDDLPNDPRELSDGQVSRILREEFFDGTHMDKFARIPGLMADAPQLVHQMFDASAQHGATDFGKWLQRALASSGFNPRRVGEAEFDGIVGPATRNALERAVKQGRAKDINNKIVDQRIEYMKTREKFPQNPGWLPRAERLRIE